MEKEIIVRLHKDFEKSIYKDSEAGMVIQRRINDGRKELESPAAMRFYEPCHSDGRAKPEMTNPVIRG
jgi:hypothetical protein